MRTRAFTFANETCAVFATLQIFLNRVTVRDWFSCSDVAQGQQRGRHASVYVGGSSASDGRRGCDSGVCRFRSVAGGGIRRSPEVEKSARPAQARQWPQSELSSRRRPIRVARDPEKWEPIFGKDHAPL